LSGKYLSVFLSNLFLSYFLIGFFKKVSVKNRFLAPKGIPLIGGAGLGLSFFLVSLAALLFIFGLSRPLAGILLGSAAMFIFGMMDDLCELSILVKFLAQFAAASILILFGVRAHIVYIGVPLNIFITLIWVIGITNAFNHLDVMDGVAGGCATIISLAFFAISILRMDTNTAVLSLALAGSCLSFLAHNFPPARVYMGNAGSHFLGFVLAAVALNISFASLERKTALLAPLLVLGLPIFDTSLLVALRLFRKVLPFKKSDDHLVLKLLGLGFSKRKALGYLLFLCMFFCLSGLFVAQASHLLAILVAFFAVSLGLFLTIKVTKRAAHVQE
jgi:UDP-GlcNAc:undecaprenyl-phosphate/decaprenyl-phosphate GlcNAc-1-phosphate transferase